MMGKVMLHTSDLDVGYGKKAWIEDIAFSVNSGEILTLIGPNGAGKSTILKSITRQLEIMGGMVYVEEAALKDISGPELAKKLSVLLTGRMETELMTCRDVVSAGRYPFTGRLGILSAEDKKIVEETMERIHVSEIADKDFNHISDGQKQRVLLAKAICQQPKILVMDEPTSYLDIRHKLELIDILKELVHERDIAVVVSLHELDLAQRCSDHLLCIGEGKVLGYGTPDEIFAGNTIEKLYHMNEGSFNNAFGVAELKKSPGEPEVFVIGGNGKGLPVYRRLQREGVPFAAGILWENDIDFPTAKALAAEVVSIPAFTEIDEACLTRAKKLIGRCSRVICALPEAEMTGAAAMLRELL